MKRNRCIFCMNEKEESEQICPVCKKGLWEYEWQDNYLEPYAVLQEKYMIGAVLEQDEHTIRYAGYDLVLEQKVLIYEYPEEFWKAEKEKKVKSLFGKILSSGIAVIKDYFLENGKGYMITTFPEGENLESYIKEKHKIEEEKAEQMLRPVLRAVNGFHAAGQVHGNISLKHLVVIEDGTLRLLADCKNRISENDADEYKAPEQLDSDGVLGPWTDVYALCAVWYEMVTGHKIQAASDRIKKDNVRSPHWYTKIRDKTERTLMRGISLESQMRFFSIGNLLESIDLPREEEEKEMGVIRHVWGENWLNTAQQEKKRRKKNRVKGYFLKRIAAAMICLICLSGLIAGGLYTYIQTHQPDYFAWKLQKAKEKTENSQGKVCFDKGDTEYKEILDYLLEYGEKQEDTISDTNEITYEIKEENWNECPVEQGVRGAFYLDYKTAKNVIQYYMKIEDKMDLMKESGVLRGKIYKETEEEIILHANKENTYKVRGENETVVLSYDPLSRRLGSVKFQASKERCSYFLEKILPFLVPETYLTEQECREITGTSLEKGEYFVLEPNAKCQIIFKYPSDAEKKTPQYSVEIKADLYETSSLARFEENPSDETVYAGNYERGSSKYKKFVSYVKKHAISKAKIAANKQWNETESTQFVLNESDVLKWGEPCNEFRFFVRPDDLVRELKDRKYQMVKESEEKKCVVELQKYGAILTDFSVIQKYKMTDDIFLDVKKDLVNGKVISLKVYQNKDKNVPSEKAVADILRLISDKQDESLEDFEKNKLQIQSTGSRLLYWFHGAIVLVRIDEEDNLIMTIMPPKQGNADYYWPQ